MEEKITLLGTLRYLRDKAGALLASFWMFILLAGLTFWLLGYLLQVDKEFIDSLAEFSTIPTATLLGLAVGMRIVTVVYGPAAIWNKMRGEIWRARWFKIIGYSLAVILMVHCMFIASKMMGDQLSQSSVIAEVEETKTSGNDAQITALNAMAEGIRKDRDSSVAEYRTAINNITSDGLDNDHEADAYRLSIEKAQEFARAELARINKQKLDLMASSTETSTSARESQATQRPFHDGFIVMARVFTGVWNPDKLPSSTVIYVCGIVFWLVWFGFIEWLVMAFSTMAFAMLQLSATTASGKRFTIDGQEVTEEELAHALQKHENQKEGGKKAARTRAARASTGRRITDGKNAKPIEEFRRAVLDMLEENKDLQEMSKDMGLTLPEFASKVSGLFEDKELEDLGLKEMMEGLEDANQS